MALITTCWLTFAGLFWWGATLQRHERVLTGRPLRLSERRALRTCGSLLLLAAPWPWMLTYDVAMALVAWLFCALPALGVTVALSFAFIRRAAVVITGARIGLLLAPRQAGSARSGS